MPPEVLGERYIDQGLIGRGGMGEVRRAFDRLLQCVVAMKILSASLADNQRARARFISEGTITAQLQHPGIVAVHDRGERASGRLWYTMSEVRGETFAEQLADGSDHAALRRRIATLARVCEAVAYAHRQGVVHRDLKPDNVMVGAFGEVMVMDWGIAARTEELHRASGSGVVGTPTFMAPEQALGRAEEQGPWSDVYALGAMLHLLLVGAVPIRGSMGRIVAAHRTGSVQPLDGADLSRLPATLVELCRRCLAPAPGDRFSDAAPLAAALQDWLAGAERQARARRTLAEAMTGFPRIAALRKQARDHREAAAAMLMKLSSFAPVAEKEPAWEAEDAAIACEREAAVLEAGWLRQVGASLEQDASLSEAHDALADHYAARLQDAEALRQHDQVARFEAHLRQHDRGRHAALLSGIGAVSLTTDPPGATVRAFRFVEQRRRLVPVLQRELGCTPLVAVPLERGSWLLEISHPGHDTVRYPVFLGRGEQWHGMRPGDTALTPISLPRLGMLGPEDCHVPAGWFWSGGDPEAVESLPRRRLWLDGLVVRRYPVTVAEFLAAREDVAALRSVRPMGPGWEETRWVGSQEQTRLPVVGLDLSACLALAAWIAEKTGQPWRLPNELEFEKYARGVDGRHFSWGDHLEAAWANILGSDPARAELRAVDSHPTDVSPYGVVGIVGNVRERCVNTWEPDGPLVRDGVVMPGGEPPDPGVLGAVRGGSYRATRFLCRAASRFANRPEEAWQNIGVRLVYGACDRHHTGGGAGENG